MRLVTSEEMRALDRRAMSEASIPGETLMERAGRGVADAVESLARIAGMSRPSVLVVAGGGNNGGDAFVAARHLAQRGFAVGVWLAAAPDKLAGDARTHFGKMTEAGIAPRVLALEDEWNRLSLQDVRCDVVVDGILGTGSSGAPRGAAAAAVRVVNRLGTRARVVAIDIPSGLNADTGEASGDAVVADVTVTMGLPKTGLAAPAALEYVGAVEVVDIGIPHGYIPRTAPGAELITALDISALFARRRRASHKGSYGHALIVAGAAGYSGAPALAAAAAVRSGAGLVTVLTPRSIATAVACAVPEAMVHPAEENADGTMSAEAFDAWGKKIQEFNTVLIGPGLTAGACSRRLVDRALAEAAGTVVLDADAINVCKCHECLPASVSGRVVLTPHPGELGRFLGCTAAEVQSDRPAAARRAAKQCGGVVLLKGAGSIVAQGDGPVAINLNGNPGMATGGTGDVLAGLLAGFLATGLGIRDASCAAAYLHGRAGDRAALKRSQAGLTAWDVVEELPLALLALCGR